MNQLLRSLSFVVLGLIVVECMTPQAHADFVYVAEDNGSIVKYDTSNGSSSPFAMQPNGTRGLTFDLSGNLLAANYLTNTITKYSPCGVGTVFASTGLSSPSGITLDSSGNLSTSPTSTATPSRSLRPEGSEVSSPRWA